METWIYHYKPEEIRQFRKNSGLSQQALASLVGVSLPTVKRWESGKAVPQGRHLRALNDVIRERPTRGGVKSLHLEMISRNKPLLERLVFNSIANVIKGKKRDWDHLAQEEEICEILNQPHEMWNTQKVETTLLLDRTLVEKCGRAAEYYGVTMERMLEAIFKQAVRMPIFDIIRNKQTIEQDDDEEL